MEAAMGLQDCGQDEACGHRAILKRYGVDGHDRRLLTLVVGVKSDSSHALHEQLGQFSEEVLVHISQQVQRQVGEVQQQLVNSVRRQDQLNSLLHKQHDKH
eukprot:TRINITY_DN3399_c0_g1_i3.p3 TRINITY_DN3399_c0_g1~~TRINITY_DN3399_c0_g1_i3.p3  ORF type:complete len:101 (-),score=14.56 TRINITY_DN3399_c0_g1_i3:189-491(-)